MSKYRNSYSSYNSTRSSYTEPTLQDEEKKEPETKTGVVYNCELLNVRSSPDKTLINSITVIKKGDRVSILDSVGSWYKVQIPDGRTGYVLVEFINIEEV